MKYLKKFKLFEFSNPYESIIGDMQDIANNFISEMSKKYDLRLGKPFDKEKANCSWFTKVFFDWAKSKSIPVEIVYFDSDVEAHIAPLIGDKVIDFAVKQFTKEPNDNYKILEIDDYKKWGYQKAEILKDFPEWATVRDAQILERYRMLDYLNLSDFEDKLNLIENTFKSLPKDEILDCIMELTDVGLSFDKSILIHCLWKGEELIQSKDRTTSDGFFTNLKTKDFWTGEGIFGKKTIKILMTEQVEALFNIKTQPEIEQFTNNDMVVRTFTKSIKEEAEQFEQWLNDGWMPCFVIARQKSLKFNPFPKPEVVDALKDVREKLYNIYGYEMILFPTAEEPSFLFIDKKYIHQL